MATTGFKILVIESEDSETIADALSTSDLEPAETQSVGTMREATRLLATRSFDAILLDLELPDSYGLSAVARVRSIAESTPLIVFCDELDGPMAIQAVLIGAQDYLIKEREGATELARSVRYSISAVGARTSLAYLAQHDPVTGLINRILFDDRLEHALTRAVRHSTKVALFTIDIDGFKGIDRRYGHEVGDSVLTQAAVRMTQHLRKMDTLARSHDDTFLLIAEDVRSHEGASVVARKILTSFEDPFDSDGTPISVTVSIGMAVYPDEAGDGLTLIRNAETALAVVKARGGNGAQRYGAPS